MKKLLLLLAVLVLVSGLAFAQEEEEQDGKKEREIELFDWEFQVAFPVHWANGIHDAGDIYPAQIVGEQPDKTPTANIAVGTTVGFNFTKKFGIVLDFDIAYMTKLMGYGTSASDSNSMLSMNLLLGPQFYVANSHRLRVPIAIGLHAYYFSDEVWMPYLLHDFNDTYWMKRTDWQFGVGVMVGVQFHFDNSIYLFSRTSIYMDFIRMQTVEGMFYGSGNDYDKETHTDLFKGVNWGVKPAIGLGIKF